MGRNFSNASADASTTEVVDQSGAQISDAAGTSQVVEQEPDASHGQGGLYEVRDGQRVLIERTAQAAQEAQEGSAA